MLRYVPAYILLDRKALRAGKRTGRLGDETGRRGGGDGPTVWSLINWVAGVGGAAGRRGDGCGAWVGCVCVCGGGWWWGVGGERV